MITTYHIALDALHHLRRVVLTHYINSAIESFGCVADEQRHGMALLHDKIDDQFLSIIGWAMHKRLHTDKPTFGT